MASFEQAIAPAGGFRVEALRALVARSFLDARTRTIAFASLFGLYAYVQPVGYRHAYPSLAGREAFAHSFASNDALRLFYGYPFDVVSVGGYSAWRVGGTLAIAAAVFGVLGAVRALRAEEEAGRSELILVGCVERRGAFLSSLAAVALGTLLLWIVQTVAFVLGGLDAGGSMYLALSVCSVIPVFAGVGALSSQIALTRRGALELGTAVVGLSLLLRVAADTATGAGWLRWGSPLGWAEQMRPFSDPRPGVLVLPLVAGAVMLVLAAGIAARRDVGTGLWTGSDSSAPNPSLLRSPLLQALRGMRGTLAAWAASIGLFALVLGVISASITHADISGQIRRELAKLGSISIATPAGYLSLVFTFFVLTVSLFVCAQINAARHEEAEQRLETLLASPVSRTSWLLSRMLIAACSATALSLLAGALAWVGCAAQGVDISLPSMLAAGANCLPVALLFLAFAAAAYAVIPRAAAAVAYLLVSVAFLWQLVGSLLSAPRWLLELTPFAHVGLLPTQSFKTLDAVVMLGLAAGLTLTAVLAFRRRDLIGE